MNSALRARTDELNLKAWELRYSEPDASKVVAEEAYSQAETLKYERGNAYACLNLAVGHFFQSRNREALKFCFEALFWFQNHREEDGYASTLTYIANIYESFGDYENALEQCQEAIKAASKHSNKEFLGEAQSVLGLIQSRLSDYGSAMDAYVEGLRIREELGDIRAVASSLNRIARLHTLQHQYEQALDIYRKSLAIREKFRQSGAIPWTYLGMASTYEDMGKENQAREYYEKILLYRDEGLDDRCRLQATLGLGRIMQETEQQQALSYYRSSLDLANQLEAKPLQVEVHQALAGYFESSGDYKQALHHYRMYRRIQEQVLNDETRIRLKNQEIKFAIEQSESEKEIYQLRNVELKSALELIRSKNIQITESIEYASRIQMALLPQEENMADYMPDHFILYLPRDVVSGDFYWSAQVGQQVIFTVADCTGHGVPGALMSMLGISFLNEIVVEKKHSDPGQILNMLRNDVSKALKQTGSTDEQKDGLDIALCAYDPETLSLKFAGARNPLYLIRQGSLEIVPATRMTISYPYADAGNFQTNTLRLQAGDLLYLFSDGFADQFGGPKRKKLKYKQFRELLISISDRNMEEQKKHLQEYFLSWKGDEEQYDDVAILGIRI
jgi:serine phosphatase RsbU (regulator of sigma subunit)